MSRSPGPAPDPGGAQRLDKWLWFARVVKTRSLATALVQSGKVRVNRIRTDKPSHTIRPGDVITVTAHSRVRVLKVLATGERRGPATEARELYEELTPPPTAFEGHEAELGPQRAPGSGRPTKRDRRAIERLMKRES
ncbi:MAG: RNA-binding S4 domain-containing protein [Hyphomicrobiaceae bacterium]|jgi:Ribosome-associated heat shock protein implicated in the recycling of the 50S subunit (S4 paralog)